MFLILYRMNHRTQKNDTLCISPTLLQEGRRNVFHAQGAHRRRLDRLTPLVSSVMECSRTHACDLGRTCRSGRGETIIFPSRPPTLTTCVCEARMSPFLECSLKRLGDTPVPLVGVFATAALLGDSAVHQEAFDFVDSRASVSSNDPGWKNLVNGQASALAQT